MSPTGGGEPALAVAVARGGPVLAGHARLRVHDLVDHVLQERARQLPRVEEPVAWVGSCCKVSIAAVPPAFDVGGVEEKAGEPDLPEVPGEKLRDPRVQRPAHRAYLVL